ncbi:hypothetical protein Y032_0582g284 [Ancylostoma ceylanicum]|uniref:Uncharacterized protein n=1 Tax=Ancylostoma ceylanicum TaxID=53326 RepID=A0A016WN74_9BILA|nr:hypothetical protein Y032_0582g284 [Ancylostoma ceylanicum]
MSFISTNDLLVMITIWRSLAELRPLADSSVGRGRLELVPLDKFPPHHVMDYASDSEYFQKCRYIHEVELVNMKLQMRILETHLETKDRLIRNLEDIIDEQETRISHMEDFIQGDRAASKGGGIAGVDLDFVRGTPRVSSNFM